MKKFSLVLQTLIKVSLIFLFTFIWTRYFIRQLWLALVISMVLTLIIDLSTRLISSKLNKKRSLKAEEKEEAENMFLNLCLSKNNLEFFYNLLSSRKDCVKKKDFIICKSEFGEIIVFPYMKFDRLSLDAIAKIYSKVSSINPQKIIIPCGELDKESLSFSQNLPIEIIPLDKYQTYDQLYRQFNCFPEITIKYKKDKKANFKELLYYSFNKQRTLGYLFAATILLISSIFVRRNIYYCVVGSLLVLFALISFTNPFFNTKTEEKSLF